MSDVQYQHVTQEEAGQRLDNYLMRFLKGVPKSHVYRIIRSGEVRVNKKRAQPSSRVEDGDMIRIPPVRYTTPSEVHVGKVLTERLHASIVHEDGSLLVVNKPSGIAVHGGSGLSLGVIEALRKTRPDLAYLELVHRLDKETSGCLLLAKKRSVLRAIQALFTSRQVTKTYWTLLDGAWVGRETCVVNASLEKNTLHSGERVVRVNEIVGKAAETRFQLLENYSQACWVEATPKTGRTHQIRVHSAHLEHPILGDEKYATCESALLSKKIIPQRLYLHARAIRFNLNDVLYQFQADLDEKFTQALHVLRLSKE
jgi:23S rRNA pseudouridine955/2504/2580 synthase